MSIFPVRSVLTLLILVGLGQRNPLPSKPWEVAELPFLRKVWACLGSSLAHSAYTGPLGRPSETVTRSLSPCFIVYFLLYLKDPLGHAVFYVHFYLSQHLALMYLSE